MISRLRGLLIEKNPPKILLDVQGVGYELDIPMINMDKLPAINEEIIIYTHLSIREDAHQLYGFVTLDDRHLFRLLIGVNGIGPKTALGILSALDAGALVEAIRHEDVACLTHVPGIGKKTAERLLIELRDKLAKWVPDFIPARAGDGESLSASSTKNRAIHEAIQALVSLGYKPQEATHRIEKFQKFEPMLSSEEMIKKALQI